MADENLENDHDYIASRTRNADDQNVYFEIVTRNPLRLRMQNPNRSNSDHDYLPASQSENSSVRMQNGNLAADYDVFEDFDDVLDVEDITDEVQHNRIVRRVLETIRIEPMGISPSGSSTTTAISTGNDSDSTSSSDLTTASHLTIFSDATRTTYDTASSVSSRTYSASSNSEASTSSASVRSMSESNDGASTSQQQQEESEPTSLPAPEDPPAAEESVISLSTPSPPKKRKRVSVEAKEKNATPLVKSKDDDNDDEDDGLTCPICLDSWEMSGEHRLTSLKCGHLFGESCIRRWLQESARQSGQKVCPQCKTKATPRDLRYLYAKRLRAIDRSEEHRMRTELCNERSKCESLVLELATMKMTYAQATMKLKSLEADNQSLKRMLRTDGGGTGVMGRLNSCNSDKRYATYKLFMEKNIELSKESGCRVMTYASHHASLLVSQKSPQGLFPGYGLRFIDTCKFKPTNFLHTSAKEVRDISLSQDQQLLAVASLEQKVKLFDLRSLQATAQFKPSEKLIWSCALAHRDSERYLYLGSQHGTVYSYDIRNSERILYEYTTDTDYRPAIQVAAVSECEKFPLGGFIVCKLTSLWFYEYIAGGGMNGTRLAIEGKLISMSYDANNHSLLIQTRGCVKYPLARFMLGHLDKIDGTPVFDFKATFSVETCSPVMVRPTQIDVDSNTLVAAYIQGKKTLTIFDANTEQSIQSISVQDVVYDTCPIYVKDLTYMAALSETKCRLYKLLGN